jgi:hypothetical protein
MYGGVEVQLMHFLTRHCMGVSASCRPPSFYPWDNSPRPLNERLDGPQSRSILVFKGIEPRYSAAQPGAIRTTNLSHSYFYIKLLNYRCGVIFHFCSLWYLLCTGAYVMPNSYKGVCNLASHWYFSVDGTVKNGTCFQRHSFPVRGSLSYSECEIFCIDRNLMKPAWRSKDSFCGKYLNLFICLRVRRNFHVTNRGNQARPFSEYALNILMEGECKTERKQERDVKKGGEKLE